MTHKTIKTSIMRDNEFLGEGVAATAWAWSGEFRSSSSIFVRFGKWSVEGYRGSFSFDRFAAAAEEAKAQARKNVQKKKEEAENAKRMAKAANAYFDAERRKVEKRR